MKTILVPTDFSSNAQIATRYAVQLAQYTGLNVHLLNSYVELYAGFDGDKGSAKIIEQKRQDAQTQMDILLDQLRTESTVEVNGECVGGYATDVINKRIREGSYALVVMGTKGASNTVDKMLGSTTYDIIAQSATPVLAVPASVPSFRLDRVGFFTVYHDTEITTLLRLRHALGQQLNLLMLHLYDAHDAEPLEEEEKWEKKIDNEFPDGNFSFKTVRVTDINAAAVSNISQQERLDLVVFSRPHKSFFTKIFVKSLTKDVAIHLDIPSLFINV